VGKHRSPVTRLAGIVVATATVSLALAGCQAAKGAYTYADAQDATHSATTVVLAGVSGDRRLLADAHITCPSDTGYFSTSFSWRTITRVSTDGASDSVARSVASTLDSLGWKVSATRNGITTITPPAEHATPKHVARILTDAEPGATVVTVYSTCYGG